MAKSVGDIVFPGDIILIYRSSSKCVIGPGLREDKELIYATLAGKLCKREDTYYWVSCHQKRYVPMRGDRVIGIVTGKPGDIFKLDIGSSDPAILSFLAFEAATKRNRPDVKIGDIIYGRLAAADRHIEPEMVCINSKGQSQGLGVLRDGGNLIKSSVSYARRLLSPECKILKLLGASLPFEIAVGQNGWIWIKGRSIIETLALTNTLEVLENKEDKFIKDSIRILTKRIQGF